MDKSGNPCRHQWRGNQQLPPDIVQVISCQDFVIHNILYWQFCWEFFHNPVTCVGLWTARHVIGYGTVRTCPFFTVVFAFAYVTPAVHFFDKTQRSLRVSVLLLSIIRSLYIIEVLLRDIYMFFLCFARIMKNRMLLFTRVNLLNIHCFILVVYVNHLNTKDTWLNYVSREMCRCAWSLLVCILDYRFVYVSGYQIIFLTGHNAINIAPVFASLI